MVEDGGHALLDAVHIQGVGAGAGALERQMPVDVPPLPLQDLQEVDSVITVDAQAAGQGGVDMGMGVNQARHDDAAFGVDEFRGRVLGL